MESDVQRLKFILTMRRLGIGIAKIREELAENAEIKCGERTAGLLLSHLETLRKREAEVLKQLEDTANILSQVNGTVALIQS